MCNGSVISFMTAVVEASVQTRSVAHSGLSAGRSDSVVRAPDSQSRSDNAKLVKLCSPNIACVL